MSRLFCLAILTAGLSACQTAKLERGTSVRLTSDQISDVKASVVEDLRDAFLIDVESDNRVQFGKIAAAKNSKGIISLCGYVRRRADAHDMVFYGILENFPSRLHNDRVLAGALGKDPEGAASLLAFCRDQGINL